MPESDEHKSTSISSEKPCAWDLIRLFYANIANQ